MYQWRQMTDSEREATLTERREKRVPWHSPPHKDLGPGCYLITGTCYEHNAIIGITHDRVRECSEGLLTLMNESGGDTLAWCVLPNHYHFLVYTEQVLRILDALKLFHGRKAYAWNHEDNQRGRKVFRNYLERFMKTEDQFRRAINYVHHNPVKHGYVAKWDVWEFSSARVFLEDIGREEAKRWWLAYPIGDFGDGWDD